MSEREEKGYVLRKRYDTNEWVHDFKQGVLFTHVYCLATPVRNSNG